MLTPVAAADALGDNETSNATQGLTAEKQSRILARRREWAMVSSRSPSGGRSIREQLTPRDALKGMLGMFP